MYDAARAAHIQVVAGTIIPFNTATPDQNQRMHTVNAWVRDTRGVMRVSTSAIPGRRSALPGLPDRLVSSPDGLHPSPDGYKLMAAALEPAIKAALAKAQSLR